MSSTKDFFQIRDMEKKLNPIEIPKLNSKKVKNKT